MAKLGPAVAVVDQFGNPHELVNGRLLHAPHPSLFPLKVVQKLALASPTATSPTYQTPSPKGQALMYICCIFTLNIGFKLDGCSKPFFGFFSTLDFSVQKIMMVKKGFGNPIEFETPIKWKHIS